MKEIKAELKERDIPFSWIESLNILNISVLPNLIHRFNIKPANRLFHEYSQTDSKFYTERQKKPLKNQHSIEGEEQSHRTDTPQLQTLL